MKVRFLEMLIEGRKAKAKTKTVVIKYKDKKGNEKSIEVEASGTSASVDAELRKKRDKEIAKLEKKGYTIVSNRGRKKASEKSDENDKGEGIRQVTLIAKISHEGKKIVKEKSLGKINVESKDIEKKKKDWEKQLNKEYDYEADVDVVVKFGEHEIDSSISKHTQGAAGTDFDIEY